MRDRIRLRDMESGDLDVVTAIEAASYSVPWSAATFKALLDRSDAVALVLEVDGRVAGYAALWSVGHQGELGNVAVAERWRRRGLAAHLLAAVLERARKNAVSEVFLEVRPSNEGARRLYERFGFQVAGRRRHYYQHPAEDAIVMRLDLGDAPYGDD